MNLGTNDGKSSPSPPLPHGDGLESKLDETTVSARSGHETAPTLSPANPIDGTVANWIGKSLGKYQVTEILGKGGMGVVLKAHDGVIGRDVAIKVLAGHLAANDTALARFLAEARAAGQLNHPNVASIYEMGQEGTSHFLVMEYLPGGSLGDRLEKLGPLSVLEATRAMVDACQGIAAAHAAGLIHRDLKPANFMRTGEGSIKVTDFGLAKATSDQSQQMTQAGTVIGTPFFMSPEQCQGETVDARSDIYSLGATYYSLLTGKNPYHDSSSVPQLMYAHCHGEIPDPRAVDESIPPACSRIIAKAMAKAPANRYMSAKAMLADLELVRATLSGQTLSALPSESGNHQALLQGSPAGVEHGANSHRTRYWMVGSLAVLLAALVALFMFWRPWEGRTGDDGPAVTAAPAATEPIKIGVLHSLSGTMAISEMVVVDATLFAIDEINQSGGVLGRPLKAVVADGRSNPGTFAREAERLIIQEQVSTIFGCWTSASRKTVKPVVEEHDHLLVYPLQYEGLEASPNIVYMGATPNQQILPAVDWAFVTLGKRRFFLVGSDYVFPRAANEIIKDELKRLGAEVVGEQYLPLGSTDDHSIVQAIAQAKPDIILNTMNGDSNIAFFRALRQANIRSNECPTLSFSIGEAEVRNLDPRDVAGDYLAWTYFECLDNPENSRFVSRFHEKFPQRSITDPMESAYMGVKLWARAANDAQSLDPRSIRRAMVDLRVDSPGGIVRIDADSQHSYKTPRVARIQEDGHLQIVWAATNVVRPQPFPASRTAVEWLAFLHDLYVGWGNHWSAP